MQKYSSFVKLAHRLAFGACYTIGVPAGERATEQSSGSTRGTHAALPAPGVFIVLNISVIISIFGRLPD